MVLGFRLSLAPWVPYIARWASQCLPGRSHCETTVCTYSRAIRLPMKPVNAPVPSAEEPVSGWRMVGIAFLAQNCAIGVTAGTYGPVLPWFQAEFGTSRAVASSAIGIMYASMGVISPFIGVMLQKVAVRKAMLIGAALCALAYSLLAFAGSFLIVTL